MKSAEETSWTTAVRVLALISTVLLVITALEARTVRQARAELQQLRAEREQAKTNAAATWARQSVRETNEALRWLDTFYAEPTEGFGRRGGLCADGRLNDEAITSYLLGGYVNARASGKSYEASLSEMKAAIARSDSYRAVHPEFALQPAGK